MKTDTSVKEQTVMSDVVNLWLCLIYRCQAVTYTPGVCGGGAGEGAGGRLGSGGGCDGTTAAGGGTGVADGVGGGAWAGAGAGGGAWAGT